MKTNNMPPRLGDVVIYNHPGYGHLPAIITHVHAPGSADSRLDLSVFQRGSFPPIGVEFVSAAEWLPKALYDLNN